jgi:hypothetical protein
MEHVSAILARIAEYNHAIWQAQRADPVRVVLGESRGFNGGTLRRPSR